LEAVGLAVRKEGELSVLVTDLTGRGQELTVVSPAGRPRQLALGPFETRTEIVDASA
jgi:hypothetical protein